MGNFSSPDQTNSNFSGNNPDAPYDQHSTYRFIIYNVISLEFVQIECKNEK